jgi:hypothetical protein
MSDDVYNGWCKHRVPLTSCAECSHIDAEPARTAEAVAREREEMRESCAQAVEDTTTVGRRAGALVRATPLTATPLADERDAAHERAEKAEALLGRVDDGPCVECGETTESRAGNPGRWPVMLARADQPGRVRHHHVACVTAWLARAERAEAERDEALAVRKLLMGAL